MYDDRRTDQNDLDEQGVDVRIERRCATMVAVLGTLISPPASAATTTLPWSVTLTTPTPNTTYNVAARGTYAVEFQESAPSIAAIRNATVEVARTPTLGQDGTLANDQLYALGQMVRRDSNPSQIYGTMFGTPYGAPGTYYIQLSADTYNSPATGTPCPTENICTYASPIFSYTVVTPAPPAAPIAPKYSITSIEARASISAYLRRRHKAKGITFDCVRLSSASVGCEASYRANGRGPRKKAHLIGYRNSSGTHVKHAT